MALLPGSFDSSRENSGSWFKRVLENLQQALHTPGIRPTSANGAPLHFQAIDLSARHGKSQTFSVGIHVAILAALALMLITPPAHPPGQTPMPLDPGHNLLSYVPRPSLGHGDGGEHDPRPTRSGLLAPESSIPLAPPRLNHNENALMPVPPAVLDPNAPANVPTITNLGLPWMDRDTDSAGPGGDHGFGAGTRGNSMGDGNRGGAGEADGDDPYSPGVSPVTCIYCPDPGYTEEARKAKLQGKMLLRVLVGPDGKAQRIQILQGLGMGLDEHAEETIRTWRFSPGRDASKRPVSSWVTVETRFQLF
jgi:periplasmic protein TonB